MGDFVREGLPTTFLTSVNGELQTELPLVLLHCAGGFEETEVTDRTETGFLGDVFELFTTDAVGTT